MKHQSQGTGLVHEVYYFEELVMKDRIIRAIEDGVSRYPIFRQLRMAARVELDVYLDAVALEPGWRPQRLHRDTLMLDGEGFFAAAYGARKVDYCSCSVNIWATDVATAEAVQKRLTDLAGSTLVTEPRFTIDWHFSTSNGGIDSAQVEELATDELIESAYPEIPGGARQFIGRYVEANEAVLVLQGPPGTGKTRLIRAILGEMSRRKGEPAKVLYTGDVKALHNEEVYVKFITGEHDAFVVEDADHLLKPRADGNEHLHRFLTIADGVVRSQGRKIIFSTNLPNVGDLDEALIRPGRCFARLNVRSLKPEEARALVAQMAGGCSIALERGLAALAAKDARSHSLAEVYRCMQ